MQQYFWSCGACKYTIKRLFVLTIFNLLDTDYCMFKSQVVPENEHRALYSTHSFKILFKEGGCGTFVPLFFNLISSVRQYNQQTNMAAEPRVDPLQASQTPVDEMMRHA